MVSLENQDKKPERRSPSNTPIQLLMLNTLVLTLSSAARAPRRRGYAFCVLRSDLGALSQNAHNNTAAVASVIATRANCAFNFGKNRGGCSPLSRLPSEEPPASP